MDLNRGEKHRLSNRAERLTKCYESSNIHGTCRGDKAVGESGRGNIESPSSTRGVDAESGHHRASLQIQSLDGECALDIQIPCNRDGRENRHRPLDLDRAEKGGLAYARELLIQRCAANDF